MRSRGHIVGAAIDKDGEGMLVVRTARRLICLDWPARVIAKVCEALGRDRIIGWPCTWDGMTLDLREGTDERRKHKRRERNTPDGAVPRRP